MKENVFYKRFKEIVGCTFESWIKRDTVKSNSGSELYDWQDNNFILGGSAYDPPKLYKKTKSKPARKQPSCHTKGL